MRKIIAVFVMSFYGLGNVLFPNVDMTHLYEMYKHCAVEDPYINAADFVFEHLLNIPDIFEGLEQDEDEENEKPHEPIHLVNSCQIATVLSKPILFECREVIFNDGIIIYGAFEDHHFSSDFQSKMLRPPIV